MLLTFDGASDAYVDQLFEENSLSETGFLAQSRKLGHVVEELVPINIANTGPSHAALFSGAAPSVSGYVGQNFATPLDALPKGADVFTHIGEAETLVSAARRQGRRVACLTAPGFDNRAVNYSCDYLLNFVQSPRESMVVSLQPAGSANESGFGVGPLSARAMLLKPANPESSLPVELVNAPFQFFVGDRNAQDMIDFDTLFIQWADGSTGIIEKDQIFPLRWSEDGVPGTTALWLNRIDPATGQVELYWGQPYKSSANEAMHQSIVVKLGPWPGTLDARGLHAGRISEAGFDALNDYQAKYLMDAVQLMLKQADWDLLLGYFPYLDTVQHKYLMTSPRQLDHTDKRERYAAKIKTAYQKIDGWLGAVIADRHAAGTNFVVASDHGMVPTHSLLAITSLLESWGYKVGGDRPELAIYTSGASAHIYINGADRPDGFIDSKRKAAILEDLDARLTALRSPSDDRVFATIARRESMAKLGLDHPGNSGDLFISAASGYSLDPRRSPTDRIFFPISFDREALSEAGLAPAEVEFMARGFLNQASPGVHGHVSGTPGISAILYGLGPDIRQEKGPRADMLQVTPSIACLLGIDPPATAKAKPISDYCR